MTDYYYTVDDFKQLIHNNNSNYVLDPSVMTVIAELEIIISSLTNVENTSTKTKQYNNGGNKTYVEKRRHFDKEKKLQKEITTDDWQEIRNFKTTKIEIKDGLEKQMNNIRILLNKISNKNYDSYKQNIFNEINTYFQSVDTEENKETIIKAIFDIASTNKFYSEIYADLYKELIELFPIFGGNILDKFYNDFLENIHKIHYVDPNVDYDGYCNYTKINDHRKATSAFIVNLMKKDILSCDRILQLLSYMQDLSHKYIDEPERSNEVQEITENIFIFISTGYLVFKENSLWEDIHNKIIEFTKMNVKEHCSLSSRAIFKHLDMLDYFKKNTIKN